MKKAEAVSIENSYQGTGLIEANLQIIKEGFFLLYK